MGGLICFFRDSLYYHLQKGIENGGTNVNSNPADHKPIMTAWTALVAFIVVLMVIGATIFAVMSYRKNMDESMCLASTMDKHWSRTAHWKTGPALAIAKAQAEAIARVHLARALEENTPLCPQNWKWWVYVWGWQRTIGADHGSKRWEILYPIAQRARMGIYAYPWPKEYDCVRSYSATALRLTSRLTNYYSAREVGQIGTMKLYCPQ